jgi:hypothetical protein
MYMGHPHPQQESEAPPARMSCVLTLIGVQNVQCRCLCLRHLCLSPVAMRLKSPSWHHVITKSAHIRIMKQGMRFHSTQNTFSIIPLCFLHMHTTHPCKITDCDALPRIFHVARLRCTKPPLPGTQSTDHCTMTSARRSLHTMEDTDSRHVTVHHSAVRDYMQERGCRMAKGKTPCTVCSYIHCVATRCVRS